MADRIAVTLSVKFAWWVWPLFCGAVVVCGPMPEKVRDWVAEACGNLIGRFGTRFVNG